jgi:hypothetical protein
MRKLLFLSACLLGLSAASASAASTCTQERQSCLARGADARMCESRRVDCFMNGCWQDAKSKTCGLIKK